MTLRKIVSSVGLLSLFLIGQHVIQPLYAGDDARTEFQQSELEPELRKARALYESGKREQAILLLRSLLHDYPDFAHAHFVLGVYLITDAKYSKSGELEGGRLSDKNLDEALAHVRKAANLVPRNREYGYMYALYLEGFGRSGPAVFEFEKIFSNDDVRKDPKYRRLVLHYANALVGLGQTERALEEYRKSLAVTPDDKAINDAYKVLLKEQENRKSKPRSKE